MNKTVSGAQALALGALDSGISVVTGYPGAPVTPVVRHILQQSTSDRVDIHWTSNEKVAIEIAFGASLNGDRALVCIKSVGLNIALDPLMTLNLSGCNAGFVLLVGDDPGGWGSQNEQDSRALANLTELPWLEPTTAADAYVAMQQAFTLSEEMGLPVVVRITRALVLAECQLPAIASPPSTKPTFRQDSWRWAILPINVVHHHRRLQEALQTVQKSFETSLLNTIEGTGSQGILTSGFTYHKLSTVLADVDACKLADLKILRLGTFYPLPTQLVTSFLQDLESVLVLEETAPLTERSVQAIAQTAGLTLSICGRDTGHVPQAGEIFAADITQALSQFLPDLLLPTPAQDSRPMASREALCKNCPYIPTFEALSDSIAERGGRDDFILIGDPGCMVRAQLPPYQLLDVKHSLGSSIGIAAGIALRSNSTVKRVIALCGDSGFLHSGLGGLMDASRLGISMLVILLDNGTTALSGGQPHPASSIDTRGKPRPAVDLAQIAHALGGNWIHTLNLDGGENPHPAIESALDTDQLMILVVKGQCPRHIPNTTAD